MKTRMLVVPILILALVTVIAAPPVHAELLTLSVILAVAFGSAIAVNETVNSNPDTDAASKPNKTATNQQANINYSKLEPSAK